MSYTSYAAVPRAEIDLNGPTIPAPDGVPYELENPPDGNYIAIPVITVCVVFTAIFYLIRFYAKYLTKKFNAADYLTIIAFPLFWVYIYYSYRLSWTPGYLVNMWNVRLKDITAFSYVCWLATLLYFWLIAIIKCSILLEWVSIFVPRGKTTYFTWIAYATCVAIAVFSAVLFIMDLVNCTPFAHNWDPLIMDGFCRFDVPKFALASAITNSILDVIPLLLAQSAIWGLRMSWQKKLGVSVIFLIGIVGLGASLVRVYYATRFSSSPDTTYYFSIMALCSLCETTCANMILCVPHTPKVFKGLRETRVVTGMKSYMTLKTNATYANKSATGHEMPRVSRNKEQRLLNSRGSDRVTVHSRNSTSPVYGTTAV